MFAMSSLSSKVLLSLLLLLLLFAGCTSESKIDLSKKESVISNIPKDVDGDGVADVYTYSFSTTSIDQINIKKYLSVYSEKQPSEFSDISDFSKEFDQFKTLKDDSELTCRQNIGLSGIICLDPKTCAKLCSGSSKTCADLVEKNPDEIGFYLLQYTTDSKNLDEQTDNLNQLLAKFNSLDGSGKSSLVQKISAVNNLVYSINANPINNPEIFGLCEPSDYGISKLSKVLKFNSVNLSDKSYHYTVISRVDSNQAKNPLIYGDAAFSEVAPASVDGLSSVKGTIIINSAGQKVLNWPNFRPEASTLQFLSYQFSSSIAPDSFSELINKPSLLMKKVKFEFLFPSLLIFDFAGKIGLNYFISLSLGFTLSLMLILILTNIIHLGYNYAKAKGSGEPFQIVLKRTFGRTGVRWKSDIILATVLLVIGISVSFSTKPPSGNSFDLYLIGENLVYNLPFFVSLVATTIGFLLLYTALENYIKILILEHVYGTKLREDKDLFMERVAQLKSRLNELKELIEKLSASNFDVSEEYDTASEISVKHIDDLAKKNDHHSRDFIERELGKVEDAIDKLMERKKTADENWEKWKSDISLLVEEKEEVYVSNLITIPASLRLWALNKYASEYSERGLIFEGNVIKKKVLTPEKLARSLLNKDLLLGVIVIKGGKLFISQMTSSSGTIMGVLGAKLVAYLRTLTQKLRMREYGNMAIVGDRNVIAVLKYRDVESLIIMPKEKFKEAIDYWKEKIKTL